MARKVKGAFPLSKPRYQDDELFNAAWHPTLWTMEKCGWHTLSTHTQARRNEGTTTEGGAGEVDMGASPRWEASLE